MSLSVRPTLILFWKHILRHKSLAFFLFVSILGFNVAETLLPLANKAFFDGLALGLNDANLVATLFRALVFLTSLILISWAFHRAAALLNNEFQPRMMVDLERTAFDYLLKHSYRFFSNAFAGSLVRKVHRLSRAFEMIADNAEWRVTQFVVATVGTIIIIWMRSALIGIALVVWVVIFLAFNIFIARWKLKYDTKRAAIDSEVTGVLADAVSNSVTIQEFTGHEYERGLYHAVTERWRKIQTLTWNLGEVNEAVQALLMIALEFFTFYFAIHFYADGLLTVGDFALIQLGFIGLFDRLWDFGRVLRSLYEAFADAKEMVDILNIKHEVRDVRGAKPLAIKNGAIDFRNVTFTYGGMKPVVEHLSLNVAAREKLAFVGPSGAGKSTIVKLLLRFYDVTRGSIHIDGHDIANATLESLRGSISVVPQEPLLFHRTLLENIRYGRRDATNEEVFEAARKAHCEEFIAHLAKGYETLVGERGIKLSGGERQRVAIARAIVKNAPILVLDEATSSLDSESESFIQDALHELMKEKTVIVIAHRLSTIMEMDRIVVLEHGTIADVGTHEELLGRVGTYKKLWNIQAGGFKRR